MHVPKQNNDWTNERDDETGITLHTVRIRSRRCLQSGRKLRNCFRLINSDWIFYNNWSCSRPLPCHCIEGGLYKLGRHSLSAFICTVMKSKQTKKRQSAAEEEDKDEG